MAPQLAHAQTRLGHPRPMLPGQLWNFSSVSLRSSLMHCHTPCPPHKMWCLAVASDSQSRQRCWFDGACPNTRMQLRTSCFWHYLVSCFNVPRTKIKTATTLQLRPIKLPDWLAARTGLHGYRPYTPNKPNNPCGSPAILTPKGGARNFGLPHQLRWLQQSQ